jgi:VanZ family protein
MLLIVSAAVFFPFDFFPPNRVSWLDAEPGVHFQGEGIAYSEPFIGVGATDPLDAVTVELWLQERAGRQNTGPREIFSFYDGRPSPPLLVGEYARRIFCFSRFENAEVDEWWNQLRAERRIGKGRMRFVAVTYREKEKALYVDGALVERRPTDLRGDEPVRFSGRVILGNSPRGGDGWWGEVRGLAIYARGLTSDEIARHGRIFQREGLRSLQGEVALIALYPFDEGEGGTAANLVGDAGHLRLPRRFTSLAGSIFRYPGDDARRRFIDLQDMLQNLVLFIPLGYLLCSITTTRGETIRFTRFLVAVAFAACISIGIELLQLSLPSRYATTTDIAWNTAGALMGALLLLATRRLRLLLAPESTRKASPAPRERPR